MNTVRTKEFEQSRGIKVFMFFHEPSQVNPLARTFQFALDRLHAG